MTAPPRPEAIDWRAVFEHAAVAHLVLDTDLVIVGASDAYLRATMTERDQLIGRHLFDAFPDNPDEEGATGTTNLAASLERVLATGRTDTMAVQKYDIRRPEEEGGGFEERWWSPVNSPVPGHDGQVRWLVHRVTDVTEYVQLRAHGHELEQLTGELQARSARMEAEVLQRSEDLQQANHALRAANSAKSEFLSRMSHELRTPLTAILGFGELLELEDLADEHTEWVGNIIKAGRHLLDLLNEVLDIARIEAGDLSLSLEPVAFETVVRDTLELMQPLAAAAGVTLHSDLGSGGRLYVRADRQRLRQVLINLVSNGIKYNRQGGTVVIGVRRDHRPDRAGLAVTDTGVGIAAEHLGRLFVPFDRLDAAATGVEGTGLGLVLSRSIAERMGGSLRVESVPGQGSTFTVDLPTIEPVAIDETEVARDLGAAPRAYPGSRRVLYIEDMVANVRLVEQILKRRPDVVLLPAMLGGVGVDLAREHVPELVLLDLHLPDLPGEEVLRRLRADPATAAVPVVILSADATESQVARLKAAGADDYLTKPISVRHLLEVVDGILGG